MQNTLSPERSREGQAAQTLRVKPKWHMTVLHIVYYVIMVVFLVFYMLPFWGAVVSSFKSNTEAISTSPIALPQRFSMEGYSGAMDLLAVSLLNSFVVTVFGAAGSVFLGSICAYALGKWKFKMNNLFFIALVAATDLPFQAILIPLLNNVTNFGLYDNIWGIVLAHAIFGMPMCTTMMRGYYAEVPDALIRQAMVDGNGMWQIYWKIVIPNTKLATVTTFVFQCTSIWNEMLFALILAAQGESANAPLATIVLNGFVGSTGVEINQLMAGSMILALPMLMIYIFMGKYLISGQMSGAVTAS